MNMLLRFFIMIFLLKQQLKQEAVPAHLSHEQLSAPVVRHYRILPHDMGFRNHLPNYRYLSFIELNITRWLLLCCHQQGVTSYKWLMAMQEMLYLKEVKLLDKMTVSSQLVGWDAKYVYLEHRFWVKNQLMAVGMTKVLLINKQGKVAPSRMGMPDEQLTPVITSWNEHQSAIKSASSGK